MNVYTGFVLFSILALTNSVSKTKLKAKHRRNYPALEADADNFNEEIRDTKKLNNIRRNSAATVKDGKRNSQVIVTVPEVETLTDFILETVDILNTYEARAFEDFFHILDNEIRTYHYDGCKFSELMQNRNTRSLLAVALKSVRENTVTFTKANINEIADFMRIEMYDKNVKELLDYVNSLYKDTEHEFNRILYNLKLHTKMKSKETYNDLEQVIRDAVRTILFNHYTQLDRNTRRELKEKIETFWEKFKKTSALNDEMNSFLDTDPVNKVVKTIENKIKEYELSIRERKNLSDKRKANGNDTYDEGFQDNDMKKRTFESNKPVTNSTEEETLSEESEETTVHTKSTIKTKPVQQAQEKIKAVERNGNAPSRYSKTTESYHRKEPKSSRSRVEQVDENESKDNTDGVKYFNEFVSKKINTIENELTKLKQINDLRTRLIYSNTDEVKKVTDRIEIINEGNEKKYLKTNIIDLLQNYYDVNNEESNDDFNAMKREFNRNSNLQSRANDANKREDFVTNINNKITSQVVGNNVDTTTIVTEDLNKKVRSNNITSTDSTVDYTNPTTLENVETEPTPENNNEDMAVTDPNRIIRHRNPFEFVGLVP